jgi:septal ring factor EnvC (AmiA/AmiB activator)
VRYAFKCPHCSKSVEASFDDLILNKLGKIMSAIDDLQNAEAANAAAIQAVLADLQSQTALLATLTAELASSGSDTTAIEAVVADMQANTAKLTAAIPAAPVAAPAPAPVAAPPAAS